MADRPETQEQSIKARKSQLFEVDDRRAARPASARKPFSVLLRETPAAPLSGGVKASLWGVGALVLLLLIATLAKSGGKPAAGGGGARPAAEKAAKRG